MDASHKMSGWVGGGRKQLKNIMPKIIHTVGYNWPKKPLIWRENVIRNQPERHKWLCTPIPQTRPAKTFWDGKCLTPEGRLGNEVNGYEGLPSISHHETTALKVETSAKTSLQVADFLALESWLDMPGRPPKLVSSYFLAKTPLCSLAFSPLKIWAGLA